MEGRPKNNQKGKGQGQQQNQQQQPRNQAHGVPIPAHLEEEKHPTQPIEKEEWDFFNQNANNQQRKQIQKQGKPQQYPKGNTNQMKVNNPVPYDNQRVNQQNEDNQQVKYNPRHAPPHQPPHQNQQQQNPVRQGQARGKGGFAQRPQVAQNALAVMESLPVVTNQFKITLHSKYQIHTYAVDALCENPLVRDARLRIKEIVNKLDRELKLCFLNYIFSGQNLFSPSAIQEEVTFRQTLNGNEYLLKIRKVGSFSLDNIEQSQSERNPIQLTFLNLMIQKFMRSGSLQQVGKLPRFFRPSEKQTITDPSLGQLEIWPGYKASSYVYNTGVFLALESMNKFFRKESCYDKIMDMSYEKMSVEQMSAFFAEQQVFTEWGTKRFYRVSRVRLDTNPIKSKFISDGVAVTVSQYFKDKYGLDLDPTQPLLEVGNRKDAILLPSQVCYIETIPDALKKAKNLIAKFRKNPQEKMDSVSEVVKEVAASPELAEWGISIDTQPYKFEARILHKPSLITGNSKPMREIVDKNSFNNQILQPVALKANKWAIVYDMGDYDEANTILDNFTVASERYGLLVGEPVWIELPARSTPQTFEKYINEQVDQNLKAVVVLLPKFHYYAAAKKALDRKGVISQLVLKSNLRKSMNNSTFGLSLASELLKQLNAKAGGDLYHITLPKMKYKHTMLIGMDVCHFGPKSIVGFCATLNNTYSKYYSQVYYQKKGKEIGNREDIEKCYAGAIDAYRDYNQTNVEHIIIFRDGVGDAMRDQVRAEELQTLKAVLKQKIPMATPRITVVIVNKRINQRFFHETNQIKNPPAGTIVDNCMIYNGNANENNTYDFFLISQQTTQGCILPTHFFVAYDDSQLSKEVLQELTYNLCYYYFNWSGSIKVPAPCQYAHKVAKYTLDIQDKPRGSENLYFL